MTDNYSKVLLPLIRQVVPEVVAADLLSVQPMGDQYRNLYEFFDANRHLSMVFSCDKIGVTNA